MKSKIDEVVERLKMTFGNELNRNPNQQKRKFSSEFKRAVLSEVSSKGLSAEGLGVGLGLSRSTVTQWRGRFGSGESYQKKSKQSGFKKLEIEVTQKDPASPYLEGKNGVRIYGLSTIQMAELLRCV